MSLLLRGEHKFILVPSAATQSTDLRINLQVSGFASNESLAIWETFPDFTVLPLGASNVNSAGMANIELKMNQTFPIGTHYISVRGEKSKYYVIATFQLLPPVVKLDRGVSIEVSKGGVGAKQGDFYSFVGTGYRLREPVALWLTYPDGTVKDLGQVRTSREGTWGASVAFGPKDPVGRYFLTGYGITSNRTGVATIILTGGMTVQVAGAAKLESNRSETKQLELLELHGSGFLPGEPVSLWLTESNGKVWYITELIATNGQFTLPGYLAAVIPDQGSPIGPTTFSAYGNASKRLATVTVSLWAGSGL